ncbi:type II toxin-antitoxin system Rv0910 family toxin [Tomitella biformata]|uniref:type II toxin-antitoxin system Rv0910 family toxin n=1 Tax=Tomitella biformata TaxID=630403 RepID=UPI000467792C|nr:SRPBCC family protein [Tomitella biformata]
MTKLQVSENFNLDPEATWARASDLSRFEKWLTIHDGWRSELPETLAEGLEMTSVISVRGMRNRVDWTLTEFVPMERIALVGTGKGGTKVSMSLSIAPHGAGSSVTMDVDFSNPLARGLIGSAIARSLKGDIQRSLAKLAVLPDA